MTRVNDDEGNVVNHAHRASTSRTENELFAAVFDMVDALVLVLDRSGVIVRFNRACEQATGYAFAEVRGKHVWDMLLVPEEIEPVKAAFSDLQTGMFPSKFENVWVTKDGREKLIAWSNTVLLDGLGQVEYVIPTGIDITERKVAEDKLKLFSAAMEEAMDGIQILDLEGRIVYSNKAIEEIYGYRPEEVAGKHMNEMNVDPDFAGEAIFPVIRKKGRWSGELLMRHKSGRVFPAWLSCSMVRNEKGEPIAMVGVIRDVTRRKEVEGDIRRNSDTQSTINAILQVSTGALVLESILEHALDRILAIPWLAVESKGGIFLVDEARGTLLLKAQKGLDPCVLRECSELAFGKCLCGSAAATGELQFASTIDARHTVRYEGMPPHGNYCVPILFSGAVLGVIALYLKDGHHQDRVEVEFLQAIANTLAGVIQRKRMENEREQLIAELRDLIAKVSSSKQEWQETFDSIKDLIYITDRDFSIIKANKAFYDHFNTTPQEVIGRKYYALLYDKTAPDPDCPLARAIRLGDQSVQEITLSGSKTFLASVFPYSAPQGMPQGAISIMRDVTDSKEQEARLVITERLAALGRMASGIAHEINNPLAAIGGCAEGLMSRIEHGRYDPVFFKNYLSIIQEEIFRCKNITTGMLSFVKKESYENKVVDIHEVIRKTVDIISFQGRLKNVTVREQFHPAPSLIQGCEGELRQVFLAIISNSLDAMEDAGAINVSTGVEDGVVMISIADQGSGIPASNQDKIFDPFFTTKSDKGGTGLGLAIASKIITNHGGTISVASSEGKGAEFIIRLPRTYDA